MTRIISPPSLTGYSESTQDRAELPYESCVEIHGKQFRAYVRKGAVKYSAGRFTTERQAWEACAAKVAELKRQAIEIAEEFHRGRRGGMR